MMKKGFQLAATAVVALMMAAALSACSSQAASSATSTSSSSTAASATASASTTATSTTAASAGAFGAVANTLAQDEEKLIATYPDKFKQVEYTDEQTGLKVTYNLFLPANYSESKSYPMVVFIGDSTCAGTDATRSLTQGRGALVWATDEWQAANETIVCVPTYPETILDDHNGYSTTEYVELTKRLIDSVSKTYAVDTNRIYGTGQSMGCMTTLILASEHPDLYAACMFVDGQWDISKLSGLKNQTFTYFAAEDDTNAFNGMSEVMNMFDGSNVAYAYKQWDGTWSCDELSNAATELYAAGSKANFISWKTGTIDAGSASGSMGGGASRGSAPAGGSGSASASSSAGGSGSASASSSAGGSGSASSGMGSVGYHMASFDYAYNCVAVMEWLFQQSK